MPEDTLDLGQETHVQHPVSLVEHEVLEPSELGVWRAKMIEQPSRRGDDDVDAAPKGVLLLRHADAAEHGRRSDRGMHGEVVQVLENLRRQLARGGKDERAGGAARLIDEPAQDREEKRGGLAAPRGSAGEQVVPGKRRRNRLGLDRRRTDEAELLDAPEEARMQLEGAERHDGPEREMK